MTPAAAFGLAALSVTSASLATGITGRVLHWNLHSPLMMSMLTMGAVLQLLSRALYGDLFNVYWGLGVVALCLGFLAYDAGRAPRRQ